MKDYAPFFLTPTNRTHKKYEALRACFVERKPLAEVAKTFGYSPGSLRNLCSEFRKNPHQDFFVERKPGPKHQPPQKADRQQRIIELRTELNLSVTDISERLRSEGMPTGVSTVDRTLRQAGVPKLWRRSFEERTGVRAHRAAEADCRKLDLSPRKFHTDFGGLFLFIHDLVRLDIEQLVNRCQLPGSQKIPAGHAIRSLLALKLWGIGRPWQVTSYVLDEGLALFAGLNVIPKRSTLSEYSCRVHPEQCQHLMQHWQQALADFEVKLGGGRSFDLDFHTIPFHGKDALIEKHYVSKRSRRQKGILALVVRDAEARVFCFADATLRKAAQNDAVFQFVEYWQRHTGALPKELVFDSRFTTYENLGRLNAMGIGFITPRMRHAKMLAKLLAEPPPQWHTVRLHNIGRSYRNPRVLDQRVQLKTYPGAVRQLTIVGLGHDRPTLLLTNQMNTPAGELIDRYARRMLIENAIADAINFFHMDALSAAVPMKIDLDLQLTLIASVLYRILAVRIGNGMQVAKADNLFRKLVHTSGRVEITPSEIIVRLGRRANNPLLFEAGYQQSCECIPWLDNRALRIEFI